MPHELDANITQAGIDDALSKLQLGKEKRKVGGKEERLTYAQVKKSWRRGMPNVWHYFFTPWDCWRKCQQATNN